VSVIFCIDISGSMGGSRINCVKDVLNKSISQIHNDHPSRKVGIVLFESRVHVIGDGTQDKLYVDEIDNYDFILKNGKTISENMISKPISQTFNSLIA
jgi:uncharacterized protein YegL